MSRQKKTKPVAKTMRRHGSVGLDPLVGPPAQSDEDALADLFAKLRSGAANVAGITYQMAVTAYLLAEGRISRGSSHDVVSVTPEGLEDIDCRLRSGKRLLIQVKERGAGSRSIAMAELAQIVAHAAPALVADAQARFVVATSGAFGSGLPATGRETSLLSALESNQATTESLVSTAQSALDAGEVSEADPHDLLSRTHLLELGRDLAEETLQFLEEAFGIGPAAASIIRVELLRDLAALGAAQREAQLATASSRSLTDLDALATRVLQAVDVSSLQEGIHAGVCEPADFVARPRDDAATFLAGVDVTPVHVAAGFDVLRVQETMAVVDGLEASGDVVITGPSGSGKSALLWRSVYLLKTGMRVLRVLRIADHDDVELLVRHVRRQMPRPAARLIVAVDDLGRDSMAAWVDARRRLREIDGVLIIASVRREDLTPGISADAVVVEPALTEESAVAIHDAIAASGLQTAMEADEAVGRADGLLMEFIALVTTGRRLRDVLATQVEALRSDSVRREVLRLICGAHLLGSSIPADALPDALGQPASRVGEALDQLAGEHLIVAHGRLWHGLHDLRTETLFELLHTSPPPTAASTYAAALRVIPPGRQGPAARRAAVRISRKVSTDTAHLHPSERLAAVQAAIVPIATSLGAIVSSRTLAGRPPEETALHVASLLEAADRLDTVAYAQAVLPFIDKNRPRGADLSQLAFFTYNAAIGGLTLDGPLQQVGHLASKLPARLSRCADRVADMVPTDGLERLAISASTPAAIRLCEAAEAVGVALPAQAAISIYEKHIALPEPPGAHTSISEADRRAQLTATLASLSGLRGSDIAAALGSVEARAADAVASDPFGCSIDLRFEPDDGPRPSISELARDYTYADNCLLVADARLFVRLGPDAEIESSYPPSPGSDGTNVNDQGLLAARRVMDACPEADRVDIQVINADLAPIEPDGIRHLRAGVLPRTVDTARNVAFQASVSEALGAENWTTRLRAQAAVAAQLVELLRELPRRLAAHDNARRRRDWSQGVQAALAKVVELPARPADRQAVLGVAQDEALGLTALASDEALRRPDHAKAALQAIAGALAQVAANLDRDPRLVALSGNQLGEAADRLRQARNDGTPSYAGVGETLPPTLDQLSFVCARLLTASQAPDIRRAINHARGELDAVDRDLTTAATTASAEDAAIVKQFLGNIGVQSRSYAAADPNPAPLWRNQQTVVVCALHDWPDVVSPLQAWDGDERQEKGLTGRVTVIPEEAHELLPFGLTFANGGAVLPIDEEVISLASAIGRPARELTTRGLISDLCTQLLSYSYETVRTSVREKSWATIPEVAVNAQQIAESVRIRFGELLDRDDLSDRDLYRSVAAQMVLQLCDLVSEEEPLSGLAAQVASINIRSIRAPEPGSSSELLNAIQVAALEADRGAI